MSLLRSSISATFGLFTSGRSLYRPVSVYGRRLYSSKSPFDYDENENDDDADYTKPIEEDQGLPKTRRKPLVPEVMKNPKAPVPKTFIAHRETMKKKFPNGWNPPKKLSRDQMDELRSLHHSDPQTHCTANLAERFKISPEAVRRILRSKWQPGDERKREYETKELQEKADRLAYFKEQRENKRGWKAKTSTNRDGHNKTPRQSRPKPPAEQDGFYLH